MKTTHLIIILFSLFSTAVSAQNPKLAVIGLDNQVSEFKSHNLTELLRIEFSKHNKFEITDRYEVNEVLQKNGLSPSDCFSKSCQIKAGKLLEVDKIAAGSIDKMGQAIYIRIRILDVNSERVDKEVVKQFVFIPEKIGHMLTITVNELLGLANDPTLVSSLTSEDSYENAVNNPEISSLSLQGPRMGYTFIVGEAADQMASPRSQGGYDAYPAMFQFGYQFETQYLNEGKFQALFEFIPMVSGLDQGLFIPSFTFMNGLRNNVNGVEFAIGPSINFIKTAKYVQDPGTEEWIFYKDYEGETDDLNTEYKMDSRGGLTMKSYVVLAAGFSLRSGKMNIPINAFVIPAKETIRFGFSFGFNSRG